MKTIWNKYFLIILIIFNGCEADFNPIGEFQEKIAVFAIINQDTSSQVIQLSKMYKPDLDTVNDPTVKNADIKILYKDEVYQFEYTELNESLNLYNNKVGIYTNNNLRPNEAGETLQLQLNVDGHIVEESITIPEQIKFDLSRSVRYFPQAFSPNDDLYTIWWLKSRLRIFFEPRLILSFYAVENNDTTFDFLEVPPHPFFRDTDGNVVPSYKSNISYTKEDFDSTFVKMKRLYPTAEYFLNTRLVLNLITLDESLAQYFAASNRPADEFTVRIDEIDFSNIDDNLGVFGSYSTTDWNIKLDSNYLFTEYGIDVE
jgi:hypothetical protein